jgi:hypothetical protein
VRVIVAAVVLAVSISAGCGSNSHPAIDGRLTKDHYLRELAVITEDLQAAGTTCIDSSFKVDCDTIPTAFDEASARAESLRPPLEVDDLHADLVRGLGEAADDYRALDAVIKESEGLDPLDAIVKLGEVRESRRLERAAREFEARGYRVPVFLSSS